MVVPQNHAHSVKQVSAALSIQENHILAALNYNGRLVMVAMIAKVQIPSDKTAVM